MECSKTTKNRARIAASKRNIVFHVLLIQLLFMTASVADDTAEFAVDDTGVLDLTNIIGIPLQIPTHPVNASTNPEFQAVLMSVYANNILHHNMFDTEDNVLSRYYAQNDACLNDVSKVLKILSNATEISIPSNVYALKFLDATAKIPHGVLQGKWMWVGDYKECHSIISSPDPTTGHAFGGRYFSAPLLLNNKTIFNSPDFSYNLTIGVCLPNSCNANEAVFMVNLGLSSLIKALNISNVTLSSPGVVGDERPGYDGRAITAFVICGILAGLVIIGTLADLIFPSASRQLQTFVKGTGNATVYGEPTERTGLLAGEIFTDSGLHVQAGNQENMNQKIISILRCFSFLSNSEKLVNTSTAKGPLACLNGLRVISMWWVIQGHTYAFIITVIDNIVEASEVVQRFSFQPIINGTFSVDSFFFLSGVLVAYLALKELNESGKLNWVYFFLHRYCRLTPLYGFVLMVYSTLAIYMISGPFAVLMDLPSIGFGSQREICHKYWWTNLLYINNFYPNYGSLSDSCMGWTWYLANDMQLYVVISPIVIILLFRCRKVGILVAAGLILACIGLRVFFVLFYGMYGLQGKITRHTDDEYGKTGPMYQRFYARMSVYVVGMLTGYIMASTNCRIRMNKVSVLIGWTVATAVALAVIYGQYYYNHRPSTKMTLTESVFYVSLCRTAWAASLSWLVLACVSGYGGPVNSILSWQIWAPLGRLTYSAYLVHPIVIFVYYFNLQEPVHFTDLTLVYYFLANLVVSYGVAFVASMTVEAPMIQLEKTIIKLINKQL